MTLSEDNLPLINQFYKITYYIQPDVCSHRAPY